MAPEFISIFEKVHQLFKSCPDPHMSQGEAGWCVKEILGHLIDSTSNNYQRIQRYIPRAELEFPGYDQELCVRRADYRSFDYGQLISLWYNHNKLLFHLYDNIPAEELDSKIKVGDNPAVTIRELMKDYFAHMALHEKQVKEVLAALSTG